MSTYLGQNFLKDSKTRKYIFDKVKKYTISSNAKKIIEIGPGKGAITKYLIKLNLPLTLIEKDEKMINIFTNLFEQKPTKSIITTKAKIQGNIIPTINNQDILKFNEEKFENINETFIIGNLPYYITSPILRKFFANEKIKPKGGFFMVQYEVAEKLDKKAKKKSFLRWLLNFFYDVKLEKIVPAKCFNPPPKCKSSLISILPKDTIKIENNKKNIKKESDFIPNQNLNFKSVLFFLELYSKYSRKTIGKITKMLIKKGTIKFSVIPAETEIQSKKFEIIFKKRLEELSWEEIGEIIKLIII